MHAYLDLSDEWIIKFALFMLNDAVHMTALTDMSAGSYNGDQLTVS